jgi:guanylate kinase
MMSNLNKSQFEYKNPSFNPLVIVVSGPSGVGKDAILNRLKDRQCPFKFITTNTTRRRRANEKDGIDYHFVSGDEFQDLLKNGGLLEWANVYGNWYGVPKQPVKDALGQGIDTVIKVDIQGAANIKKILPEAVFIFIMPPTAEELTRRLTRRSTESSADLAVRLKTAESEIRQIENFDYVVMNPCDNIDSAINDILAIVSAEKCRAKPRKVVL